MYGENKSKLLWSLSQDNEDEFLVECINNTLDAVVRGSEYLEKVLDIVENTEGVGNPFISKYGNSNNFYIEFKYNIDTFIRVSGQLLIGITVSMFSAFGHFVDCGCSIYNEERPVVVDNVDAYKRNMSNLIAVPDTLDSWTAMTESEAMIGLPYTKHTPVMKAIIAQLQDWVKNYKIDTIELCPNGKEESDEK